MKERFENVAVETNKGIVFGDAEMETVDDDGILVNFKLTKGSMQPGDITVKDVYAEYDIFKYGLQQGKN